MKASRNRACTLGTHWKLVLVVVVVVGSEGPYSLRVCGTTPPEMLVHHHRSMWVNHARTVCTFFKWFVRIGHNTVTRSWNSWTHANRYGEYVPVYIAENWKKLHFMNEHWALISCLRYCQMHMTDAWDEIHKPKVGFRPTNNKNAISWINTEPSLSLCSIVHKHVTDIGDEIHW